VITGASSILVFFCVEKLNREDVYVVAAVRDTAKMDAEAERSGISTKDYVAVELQLASFQSVKDFATALKATLPRGKLDRLVCNAAVYLPTDPIPRWTDDGYEMSLQVNHLGHFLLSHLLLPSLEKAQKARLCIVGSVTRATRTRSRGRS
jgi:protochlorophyllide reductase